MDYKNYEEVIHAALYELDAAAKRMIKKTVPATPLPRPRRLELTPGGWVWPFIKDDGGIAWDMIQNPRTGSTMDLTHVAYWGGTARVICKACENRPRLILRALRRIQAATAWCEARTEGRKRQAEEILRQQQKAVEALEAEAAILALK